MTSAEDEENLIRDSLRSRSVRTFHNSDSGPWHMPEAEELDVIRDVRHHSDQSSTDVLRLTSPKAVQQCDASESPRHHLQVPERSPRQVTPDPRQHSHRMTSPLTDDRSRAMPPVDAPRSPRADVTSRQPRDALPGKALSASNPNELRINLGYQSNVSVLPPSPLLLVRVKSWHLQRGSLHVEPRWTAAGRVDA